MEKGNWKVVWQSPAKPETRYFEDRMAAMRFAEVIENRSYRNRPEVSYIGPKNHMTATFAVGPL